MSEQIWGPDGEFLGTIGSTPSQPIVPKGCRGCGCGGCAVVIGFIMLALFAIGFWLCANGDGETGIAVGMLIIVLAIPFTLLGGNS